ncbi:hypothetical protein [Acinetobacter pittii]|uniref:hypothetical protein n=1 Tax=Acinetobacter pittii TaxID=48296 RepID=UPI0005C89D3F|nr:hypothetical protein [Acinetobacter pittii]
MKNDFEWLKWIAFFVVLSVIGVVVYFAVPNRNTEQPKQEQTLTTTHENVQVQKSSTQDQQETVPVSYNEVAQRLKSEVQDAVNEVPPVSIYIADLMAARNVKWDELNQIEKTTYSKVMKDVQQEGLKLLCSSGVVTEIYSFDSNQHNKFYEAGIIDDSGKVFRVIAIGSSGNIEADSRMKFCGQVTGRLSYSNAMGGTTHAPFLVGMFDLPENK